MWERRIISTTMLMHFPKDGSKWNAEFISTHLFAMTVGAFIALLKWNKEMAAQLGLDIVAEGLRCSSEIILRKQFLSERGAKLRARTL